MDALPQFSFTPTARAILDVAEREAQSAQADCIRTEHLVLALLQDTHAEPARLLAGGNISVENVRSAINNIRAHEGPGPDSLPESQLPLSAELRSALIRAHRGSELQMVVAVSELALLAGLLFEGTSTGMFCLRRLRDDVDVLRASFRIYVMPRKIPPPTGEVQSSATSKANCPPHFNRRAEQALTKAVEAAREFNAEWVGTAYLLYGLAAARGSIAHAVLESVGFESKNAKAVIVEFTPPGSRTLDNIGDPEITSELSSALEKAATLAAAEGCEFVTTEHLLFAVLAATDNNANRLLDRMNLDAEEIFDTLQRALGT